MVHVYSFVNPVGIQKKTVAPKLDPTLESFIFTKASHFTKKDLKYYSNYTNATDTLVEPLLHKQSSSLHTFLHISQSYPHSRFFIQIKWVQPVEFATQLFSFHFCHQQFKPESPESTEVDPGKVPMPLSMEAVTLLAQWVRKDFIDQQIFP